jgi:hypothetical protein
MSQTNKSHRNAAGLASTPLADAAQRGEMPSPWARTRQRLAAIRRNLDKSDGEIGQMFGITRAAIYDLRVRYGIDKVRSSTQRKERFLKMARKVRPGLSVPEVAQKLGLSERQAYYYAKRAGYHFDRRQRKDKFWKKRLQALPDGLTLPEVSKRLDVSYGYALHLCQRHRYKVRRVGSSQPPRLPVRY